MHRRRTAAHLRRDQGPRPPLPAQGFNVGADRRGQRRGHARGPARAIGQALFPLRAVPRQAFPERPFRSPAVFGHLAGGMALEHAPNQFGPALRSVRSVRRQFHRVVQLRPIAADERFEHLATGHRQPRVCHTVRGWTPRMSVACSEGMALVNARTKTCGSSWPAQRAVPCSRKRTDHATYADPGVD